MTSPKPGDVWVKANEPTRTIEWVGTLECIGRPEVDYVDYAMNQYVYGCTLEDWQRWAKGAKKKEKGTK